MGLFSHKPRKSLAEADATKVKKQVELTVAELRATLGRLETELLPLVAEEESDERHSDSA